MAARKHAATSLLLYTAVVAWCYYVGMISAQTTTATQYLRMTWSNTDVVQVTYTEPTLTRGVASFFGTEQVQVIDIREDSFPMALEAATQSTFQMLFMVRNPPQVIAATDFNKTTLAAVLVNTLLAAATKSSSDGSQQEVSTDSTTTTLTSFIDTSVQFELLPAADAQLLGPSPALVTLDAPSGAQSFMVLHVFFRNILSPAHLMQGMIYQTRQAVTRFLNLTSISRIYAAGPPEVSPYSVLQVVQRYYLILQQNVTLETRETLANLLLYGDPSRLVDDYESNDGFFATQRPSMFLDYILPGAAVSSAIATSSSSSADTALKIARMGALFSYMFSSLTVDQFPSGNPPAPAPVTPSTLIPAISTEMLASKMRKSQWFLYNVTAFSNSALLLPENVTFPSATKVIQANATSACTMSSGFCTYIYWTNSIERTFWLESMESVNRLAWNLFPSISFFAQSNPSVTPVAPIILPGNTTTPIWTLGALSGLPNRLEFALNLRNVDDNATTLKVEITTDIRSSMEATSTITSIARDTSSSTAPVYETKSNIVVNYQSRFRNANEIFLFLEIKNSTVTQKDTSQPCAHCQNLYERCGSQTKCAALASCVFAQGIENAQIPSSLLKSGNLQDAHELWPYFQNCMTEAVELDVLMLLASAVRCQMQRLCAFRTSSYYGGSDDDNKILIWESLEGKHQVQTPPTNTHFPRDTPVNISMRIGPQVLCYLPIFSNTTADSLQTTITRKCKLAKYLGHVSVAVNMTGENTTTAVEKSFDLIEIKYKYVVGPLPVLEVVSSAAVPNASYILIYTTANPGIRLRLETKGFNELLPPAPSTSVSNPCLECNRLALDVCLRDLKCVAFTDCMMRHPMNGSSTPLGDGILDTFRREPVDEAISFSSAIDACHSISHVNLMEWRKLVNASACFSKHSCPISMQMLVPNSTDVVGKWRMNPEMKIQKLLYQQQVASTSPLPDPVIPLQFIQGTTIAKTSASSVDPSDLEAKLQKLLEYSNITVETELDRVESTTQLRTMQWSIMYHHWVGLLPRFLPEGSSPMWTLFTYPSSQDFYLEVLSRSAKNESDLTTIAV